MMTQIQTGEVNEGTCKIDSDEQKLLSEFLEALLNEQNQTLGEIK